MQRGSRSLKFLPWESCMLCIWTFREEPVGLAGRGGWSVPREKYYWLVADKPNEQGVSLMSLSVN